jgi:hypothetical protein
MKRCPQCKSPMPDDVARCIRCGHDSSTHISADAPSESNPVAPSTPLVNKLARVNWLRVATVLTSNLFFLGSCTVGMVGAGLLDDPDDYGPEITEGHPVPGLVSVVATVPDPESPGQRKPQLVFLSMLGEFKAKNPDYSFLLSPGEGKVDNPAAEMWTKYSVTASGPGKVIVKSSFHHDVPPAGVDVRQRYEATARDIKLLNAKFTSGYLGPLILGLILASVLGITGRVLKWRISRTYPPLSAAEIAAEKTKATKRTLRLLAIAIGLGLLVPALIILLSSVFS